MADTPKHSVSVAGIVVDDQDRVLVIQRRDNGHWEPPGGVLELSETPQEGVRREILEETGLCVEVGELSGVYKNMTKGVVALVFRCSPVEGQLSTSAETSSCQWVSRSWAEEAMHDAYAIRVADAFTRETVATRAHDGERLIEESATELNRGRPA